MMNRPFSLLFSLLPLALAAWLCMQLSALPQLSAYAISPLTLAILAGMVLGNSIFPRWSAHFSPALAFCKTRLLRLGIVLYGFKITLAQLAYVGWPALLVDVLMVLGTFMLAMWLGRRWQLAPNTAALVGAGSAICGAAAVLATQPVLKADNRDVGVAVATVVVFGTLAMLLYPLLAHWVMPADASAAAWFGWGIYTGASVHEVAQVAAAGAAVNATVADVAVITKMIRVLLLAPFLLILPWLMRRFGAPAQAGKAVLPWFAVGFLAMVVVNSLVQLPPPLYQAVLTFDTFLLTIAMFALGLTTRWQSVREAGLKPLALAGMLALWLLLGGAALSYGAYWLFH